MKLALLLLVGWACCAVAQTPQTPAQEIPSNAVAIKLTQVNTLAGITTWTFTDKTGNVYYVQSPAYLVASIPVGNQATIPLWSPEIWIVATTTPVTPPPSTASPSGTVIKNNSGATITDASGGKWTVVNGVVLLNAAPIGFSSGVAELAIVAGVLWQENTANNWYYWNTAAKAWDGGTPNPLP